MGVEICLKMEFIPPHPSSFYNQSRESNFKIRLEICQVNKITVSHIAHCLPHLEEWNNS